MKKHIFIIILLSICSITYGQYVGPSFTLNKPISSSKTHSYLASEYIRLVNNGPGQGGFHADPWPSHPVSMKIDPFLVFPPDEGETGGASNNNTGGVVGTLPGSVMVSPTGAAGYSIPLDLPSGTAGMTPSLALVYNSQGGNGLLGIGWSLSGLSAITRAGSTIYNDGFVDGIDFDDNDHLALDGQRLIALNNGTEYRTEIETFAKITPMEVDNKWPKWFEVRTKDGRIIEYGRTDDSRIETSDGKHVLMWLINRISDRKGNYIGFEYIESNGMDKIKKISYGGNIKTGQQPYYFVEFHYTTGRQDKILSFVSGSKIEISEILTDITVKYKNETTNLQHYNLMYDWGTYTQLLNVTLYDKNGKHFNPTLFEWGEDNHDVFTEELNYNHVNSDKYFLDFNGDGKTDFVEFYWKSNNENKKIYYDWKFRKRLDNGFSSEYSFSADVEKYFYVSLVGDYNGDGFQDLLVISFLDENMEIFQDRKLLLGKVNGFTEINLRGNSQHPYGEGHEPDFGVGDFDGNGISELIVVDKHYYPGTANCFIYKYNKEKGRFDQLFSTKLDFGNTDYQNAKMIIGDYNGDGRSDILRTAEYGSSGGGHTSNCFLYEVDIQNKSLTYIYGSNFPTTWHRIFPGDFNGDGVTDILTYAYTNPDIGWEVHNFNGKNMWVQFDVPPITEFDPEDDLEQYYHGISIADFNGDGKTDIIEFEKETNTQTYAAYTIYYAKGNSFEINHPATGQIACIGGLNFFGGGYSIKHINQHIGIDFNGDGKSDLYKDEGYNNDFVYLFDYYNEDNFIQKITNGLGHETQITYKPLTDNNIYTKGTGAVYPLVDIQPALYVVDSLLADNGIGGKAVTLYKYEGAKVHQQGKGFLGYEKTTTVNFPSTGKSTKTVNTFRFDEGYYFRWLENSKSFAENNSGDNILITEITNQAPFIKPYDDKRIFFYTPASVTQVYHTGDDQSGYVKTVLKTQNFDEGNDLTYGNVSFSGTYAHPEKLDLNNLPSEYDYSTESNIDYNYDPAALKEWLISRVNSATTTRVSKKDPTSSADTKKVTYLYDGNSPYVKEERYIPNNSTEMTTVNYYNYDDYGNISRTRYTAYYFSPHPTDRITDYTYSSEFQHRFVTETGKTVNGVNFVSTADYYPETGLVKSETDVNGLTTSYFYDGFGLLKKTVFPGGVEQQQVWRWTNGSAGNPVHGLYKIWSQTSGGPPSSVYYDQLGRELRTETENFRNDPVYTDIEYNNRGQVKRKSEPYYAGEEKQWTQYTYLVTDVVKTMNTPVIRMRYTYDGRITLAENETTGIVTSKEADATGNTVNATDPGGTIHYSYYSSGQLYTVGLGENLTTVTYDAAGFQETLDDPDAGTITYNYNPFGELVSQTDNRGNQYEMLYDALGRIKSKTLTNENHTTYYFYDEEEHGKGLPSRVDGWNGISTAYKYDELSRLKEKTETINGENYTFKYDYNVFGLLKTETWPMGFAVSRQYQNGYMTRIRQTVTDKTIWELTDITARGQVKQFELGNGLLTTKGFTATGFLTYIETGNVQHLKYNFDETTGNLNWREDVSGGILLHEDFTYDDKLKNRLESWKVFGQDLYAINYADNGNFNSKTGVGSGFEYGTGLGTFLGAGLHAVTRVNQPATDYLNMARNVQQIDYTGFNKTSRVTVTVGKEGAAGGDAGDEQWIMDIVYGPDNYRRTTTLTHNHEVVKSKLFAGGNFEVETDAGGRKRYLYYISGGDGLCAIYVTSDENNKGKMYYVQRDHLGSLYAITGENGDIVTWNGQQQVYSFDPWGRRRNPDTWTFDNVPDQHLFDRGFTGHEHLNELGLINMNGRMYDPWLGRMLSPDNYVQAPDYSQNLNRYSYALNNPLVFIDPDGEVWVIDDAILGVIGGAINVLTNLDNIHSFGQGAAYFGVGFVSGFVSEYISPIGSAALMGAGNAALASYYSTGSVDAGAVVQGAVTSAAFSAITMGLGSVISPYVSNMATSITSSPVLEQAITQGVVGIGVGGAVGGVGSVMNGGDFWQGAGQGALWGGGIGFATGAYAGYGYAKARGLNPWTGEELHPIIRLNEQLPLGTYKRGQYRSNINGDFNIALQDWNNIQRQYGIKPTQIVPSGFKTTLPDGTIVMGQFYQGGNTNPNGFTIKIRLYAPSSTINKVPPVYIRYH